MIQDAKRTIATALLLAATTAAGCDSLYNPGRIAASARYDRDGNGVVFFYDGVVKVNAQLGLTKQLDYPIDLGGKGWAAGVMSFDGQHAAFAWQPALEGPGIPMLPSEVPSHRGGVAVFSLNSGETERQFDQAASAIALSDDGAIVVLAPSDEGFSPSLGVGQPSQAAATQLQGLRVSDGATLWTADGSFLRVQVIPGAGAVAAITRATEGGPAPELRVLDLTSGQVRLTVPLEGSPEALAVAADGSVAAVAISQDTAVSYRVINLIEDSPTDGTSPSTIAVPGAHLPFPDLVVSPGGHIVAALLYVVFDPMEPVDPHNGHELMIWNDGTLVHSHAVELWVHDDSSMALSPDAKSLIVPELGALRQYSVPDGAVVRSATYVHDIF
jgi:hypothetical protein